MSAQQITWAQPDASDLRLTSCRPLPLSQLDCLQVPAGEYIALAGTVLDVRVELCALLVHHGLLCWQLLLLLLFLPLLVVCAVGPLLRHVPGAITPGPLPGARWQRACGAIEGCRKQGLADFNMSHNGYQRSLLAGGI